MPTLTERDHLIKQFRQRSTTRSAMRLFLSQQIAKAENFDALREALYADGRVNLSLPASGLCNPTDVLAEMCMDLKQQLATARASAAEQVASALIDKKVQTDRVMVSDKCVQNDDDLSQECLSCTELQRENAELRYQLAQCALIRSIPAVHRSPAAMSPPLVDVDERVQSHQEHKQQQEPLPAAEEEVEVEVEAVELQVEAKAESPPLQTRELDIQSTPPESPTDIHDMQDIDEAEEQVELQTESKEVELDEPRGSPPVESTFQQLAMDIPAGASPSAPRSAAQTSPAPSAPFTHEVEPPIGECSPMETEVDDVLEEAPFSQPLSPPVPHEDVPASPSPSPDSPQPASLPQELDDPPAPDPPAAVEEEQTHEVSGPKGSPEFPNFAHRMREHFEAQKLHEE